MARSRALRFYTKSVSRYPPDKAIASDTLKAMVPAQKAKTRKPLAKKEKSLSIRLAPARPHSFRVDPTRRQHTRMEQPT